MATQHTRSEIVQLPLSDEEAQRIAKGIELKIKRKSSSSMKTKEYTDSASDSDSDSDVDSDSDSDSDSDDEIVDLNGEADVRGAINFIRSPSRTPGAGSPRAESDRLFRKQQESSEWVFQVEPELAGRKGLLSLPPELMELVAKFVWPADLLNLQLTCRDTNAKVLRPCAEVHFTTKAFLLPSAQSMQALLDISRHPIFSKSMAKLFLVAQYVDTVASVEYEQGTKRRKNARRVPANRAERAELRDVRSNHQLLHMQQKAYWRRGAWRAPLMEALENFATACGPMAVSFTSDRDEAGDKEMPSPCGKKHLQRVFGYRDCLTSADGLKGTACEIVRDMLHAPCQLSELVILSSKLDVLLGHFKNDPVFRDASAHVLRHIRKLGLGIEIFGCHRDSLHAANAENIEALVAFLAKAPALEHLVLAKSGCGSSDVEFVRLFARLSGCLPELRVVKLQDCHARADDVIDLAVRHKKTIKHIAVGQLHSRGVDQADAAGDLYLDLLQRDIKLDWLEVAGFKIRKRSGSDAVKG